MTKLFLCLIFLASCGQLPSKQTDVNINDTIAKPLSVNSKHLEDNIINAIIAHYQDSTRRMETEESDSSMSIVWYNIPTEEDDFNGILQEIEFSKIKNEHVFGDLDKNETPDIVVSVRAATGGSASWIELFLFFSINGKYDLVSVTTSSEISDCKTGDFYPEKIHNGLIHGTSICWAEEDAHCCPSLEYQTIVGIDGNKLKFISKKQTK